MKIGLSTLLFPYGSPEDCVRSAKKLELDCVEVIFDIPHFTPGYDLGGLEDLGEAIESAELDARVHGRFWDLNSISQYPKFREIALRRGKESIEACAMLGGDVVTVHPGRCWVRENADLFEDCKSWFEDYLEEMSSYARERGVTIGVETGAHDAGYPSAPEELLRTAQGRDGVGITLDVGHSYLFVGNNDVPGERWIVNLIEALEGELANVHLHDNHGRSDEHLPPGQGEINFDPILEALEKYYDGPLVLELWNPSNPLKAAEEGVTYLKEFSPDCC